MTRLTHAVASRPAVVPASANGRTTQPAPGAGLVADPEVAADTRANTFWVSYGALIGQPAMCLSAGFGLACAIVTCVILRARRTVPPVAALAGLRPAVAVSPPLRRHPAGLCPAA